MLVTHTGTGEVHKPATVMEHLNRRDCVARRSEYEDTAEMNLKEIWCRVVNWAKLAQDRCSERLGIR